MSIPVEALSLSALSGLLSYPPQYPRNPTHQTHEPLVLYIVRVPGSQDVFLTPLKPPTKSSISLEAIQTSLYYLHIERPEDDSLRQSLEAERQLEQQSRPAPPILRKPLPLPPTPFANYPSSQRAATPPKSYPHYQPGSAGHGSSQLDKYLSRGSSLRLSLTGTTPMSRKPLGARPLSMPPQPSPPAAVGSERRQEKPVSGAQLLRLAEEHKRESGSESPRLPTDQAERRADQDSLYDGSSTTITMIRRDPTSGAQWNVGSLRVTTRKSSLALLQPVDVTLTTPGYAKFARAPDAPLTAGHGEDVDAASPDSNTATSPVFSGPLFRRRLGFRPLPNDQEASVQHVRTGSSEALSDISNGPSSKKAPQVFAFTSPWHGVCAFSNGVDGRTLKCKHSLPTVSSQQESVAVPVAELRFNLPWSILRNTDPNRLIDREADTLPISQLLSRSTKQQWRRTVQNLKQHTRGLSRDDARIDWAPATPTAPAAPAAAPQPDQDVHEDDTNRISLRLGREKAGGGFKGNSAKLGKLIIEDEGLKMCDLLVAACMGVWWQHYLLERRL